jgi:hypothetical protein
VAEEGTPRPLTLRLEYRFDRLLPAKLEQVYALLVPDHRWPVSPGADVQEATHEHARRDLRARVVRSSA